MITSLDELIDALQWLRKLHKNGHMPVEVRDQNDNEIGVLLCAEFRPTWIGRSRITLKVRDERGRTHE